jgi:hypothetical protein
MTLIDIKIDFPPKRPKECQKPKISLFYSLDPEVSFFNETIPSDISDTLECVLTSGANPTITS